MKARRIFYQRLCNMELTDPYQTRISNDKSLTMMPLTRTTAILVGISLFSVCSCSKDASEQAADKEWIKIQRDQALLKAEDARIAKEEAQADVFIEILEGERIKIVRWPVSGYVKSAASWTNFLQQAGALPASKKRSIAILLNFGAVPTNHLGTVSTDAAMKVALRETGFKKVTIFCEKAGLRMKAEAKSGMLRNIRVYLERFFSIRESQG